MKHKSSESKNLFAPRQRGGVVGGFGYNFQDAYIVSRFFVWLENLNFQSFIKEGFDDVDVIFENGRGPEVWHYQLKDHAVTLREFREILAAFAIAASRTEVNATSFILASCGLAPELASLWRQILELRGLRKSHGESALEATKQELLRRSARLGLGSYGDLLLSKVKIDHETTKLRETEPQILIERFRGNFITLSLYHNEGPAVLDQLFTQLMFRVNKAIRVGLTRDELVKLIRAELAGAIRGGRTVVYLHGWARQQHDIPADVEIDWTSHFDHVLLRTPAPAVWAEELLPALKALRERFDREGDRRNIWLRARAPLSAGMAFGHAFAEAAGYSIQIQQASPGAPEAVQYWQTDAPIEVGECIEVREVEGEALGRDLVVGVGVTDDPRPKVEQYLSRARLEVRSSVYLYPTGGPSPTSLSERNVGAFACGLKREIRSFCDRYAPPLIHLFYFGPLGLAVLFGQKLNGLTDIQCYERDKTCGYTPSCRLPA
jgi:hypothetical protein